jgi:uncharacterized protein YggL (DUF469 family)
MKKRLRKKRYLGEFAQCGFEITADWAVPIVNKEFTQEESDLISNIWDTIIDYVVARRLSCGGASNADGIVVIIEALYPRTSKFTPRPTRQDRDDVLSFFLSLKTLKNVTVGPMVNLWYENKKQDFKS